VAKLFADLSTTGQVALLRPVAAEFCREFGIAARSIRLLHHAFNTTFRVGAEDGRKFALRINVNSESSLGQLNAEVEWIRVLASEGRVWVPEPQASPDGRYVLSRPGPTGRPLHGVLYGWLPGRLAVRCPCPEILFQIGQITAELHRQAASWKIPPMCRFKALPDMLYGQPFRLEAKPAFLRTLDLSEALFAKLEREPRIPIHYDLHLGNVKIHRGRLAIFDFDDAVLGWPILDAAVTVSTIQRFPDAQDLIEAYWRGLGMAPADFGFTDAEFEGLVVCRILFIVNAMLGPIDPASIARRRVALAAIESRLQRFWDKPADRPPPPPRRRRGRGGG